MKGLSSYILAIIITLILASVGLVIFWVFLKNTTEGAKIFSEKVLEILCKNKLGFLVGC